MTAAIWLWTCRTTCDYRSRAVRCGGTGSVVAQRSTSSTPVANGGGATWRPWLPPAILSKGCTRPGSSTTPRVRDQRRSAPLAGCGRPSMQASRQPPTTPQCHRVRWTSSPDAHASRSASVRGLAHASSVLRLQPGPDGNPQLGASPPADAIKHALARIALDAATLLGTNHRERLRICASPTCSARFYDASRAASRRWCSMRGCGNAAKARRHRARNNRAV